MEDKYIVYKGDSPKFKVTIHHADFDQHEDDYNVVLRYGLLGGEMTITKSDMYVDEDGDTYFMFDSSDMMGVVIASCNYWVHDEDFEGGLRKEVDMQNLCFVVDNPAPRFCGDLQTGSDGHVTYERVYRSDVKTLYLNLRTSEGENIKDVDGKQLRVRKEPEDLY